MMLVTLLECYEYLAGIRTYAYYYHVGFLVVAVVVGPTTLEQ